MCRLHVHTASPSCARELILLVRSKIGSTAGISVLVLTAYQVPGTLLDGRTYNVILALPLGFGAPVPLEDMPCCSRTYQPMLFPASAAPPHSGAGCVGYTAELPKIIQLQPAKSTTRIDVHKTIHAQLCRCCKTYAAWSTISTQIR